MLTLRGGQVESWWDVVLPVEVRELPEELARLDRVMVIKQRTAGAMRR